MRLVLTVIYLSCLAISAMAQGIAAPKNYEDTLRLMYDFIATQPGVDHAEFTDDQGLEVFLPDGASAVLYPDNLTSYLQAAESDLARQDVFEGHMQSVLGSLANIDAGPVPFELSQIMPVLRYEGYPSNAGPGLVFLSDEFPGDLTIYYVIDYPDRVEFLNTETLGNSGFTEDQVRSAAIDNLRGAKDNLQAEVNPDMGVSWLTLDGYYESSFALDTEIWSTIAPDFKQLIMIVPNRDYMVFADGSNPAARDVISQLAKDVNAQFYGAMTAEIYRWSGKNWVLD